MRRFEGKTVLVTGASAGIGRHTALEFAREGAKVVLVARRTDKLKEVQDEIVSLGGQTILAPGDVTVASDVEEIFRVAATGFGGVDILVNNAGISDGSFATVHCTDENWFRNLAVNEKSVFLCTRAALRYMTQTWRGSIINVSSIGGVYAVAGAAYSAAKRAVIGLTKNVALQYAGTDIRCNAVCPGPVPTELLSAEADSSTDLEMRKLTGEHIDKSIPLLQVEDISNAILFFADDRSVRITGQILVVDSGRCL